MREWMAADVWGTAPTMQADGSAMIGGNPFRLYEPGFHTDSWVIGHEGAYEWPWTFTEYVFRLNHDAAHEHSDLDCRILAALAPVWVEAATGWSLGIYLP